MLRIYDEGIEYEDLSLEDDEQTEQHQALRDSSNTNHRHHPADDDVDDDTQKKKNASSSSSISRTPKPPVCKRRIRTQHRVPSTRSGTGSSIMTPILNQITSSFAVMNPMIVVCIRDEERERIKAMSMCIERYTCVGQRAVRDEDVVMWRERLVEFSKGPMMIDLNQYALGKEHMRMGKGSLRALSAARKLIDGVYRFGDDSAFGETCLYLYHMVICFTAIRHVENMEQAAAQRADQMSEERNREEMRNTYIKDVLGDESFHCMVAMVCMEICSFMYFDDDRFQGGFPELTNMLGYGDCMMEIVVALDWCIKAFHTSLTEAQTAEELSLTWLGRYSPTLAKEMVMPKIVLGYALIMRERILEQGIFEGERSWLVQSVETDHPTRSIVQEYCTRHLKALMRVRVSLLVQNALATSLFSTLSCDAAGHQSRVACINAMIEGVLEILYGSIDKGDAIWTHGHITRIIICTIYCVSKAIDCPIRLVQLESLCFSCFPLHREEQDAVREWYSGPFFSESSIAMECSQHNAIINRLQMMYASIIVTSTTTT